MYVYRKLIMPYEYLKFIWYYYFFNPTEIVLISENISELNVSFFLKTVNLWPRYSAERMAFSKISILNVCGGSVSLTFARSQFSKQIKPKSKTSEKLLSK